MSTGNRSREECGQEKQGRSVMKCWNEESRVQRTKQVVTITRDLDLVAAAAAGEG